MFGELHQKIIRAERLIILNILGFFRGGIIEKFAVVGDQRVHAAMLSRGMHVKIVRIGEGSRSFNRKP